jgi:hypothetical protein
MWVSYTSVILAALQTMTDSHTMLVLCCAVLLYCLQDVGQLQQQNACVFPTVDFALSPLPGSLATTCLYTFVTQCWLCVVLLCCLQDVGQLQQQNGELPTNHD